jgi:rubrerythrin
MKIYKTQKEFEKEIKDGVFFSDESIDLTEFDLNVNADIEVKGSIIAKNITAKNIHADDISAWDINMNNIVARNIMAWNINASGNIEVIDIKAENISANDISAIDIKAKNINARDVTYYAVAFAYNSIKVRSIRGMRKNAKHFVLDGKLEIEDEKNKIVKPYSTKKIWICPSCDLSYERKILDICPRCDSVIL